MPLEVAELDLGSKKDTKISGDAESLVLKAISDGKLTRNEVDDIMKKFKEERDYIDKKYEGLKIGITKETAEKLYKMANEFGFSELSSVIKENSEVTENSNETSLSYFGINPEDYREIQDFFERYGFGFDLKGLLDGYKNYIESNLKGLPENYIKGIKNYIKNVIVIGTKDIIEERIKFVDSHIKSGKINPENRDQEIKNQRWIVNDKILFDRLNFVNNRLLPSSLLLKKYDKNPGSIKDPNEGINSPTGVKKYNILHQIQDIREMFDDGFLNGKKPENYYTDAIFDSKRNYDKELGEKNGINSVDTGELSLLNEEDKSIEKRAQIAFYAAIAAQIGIENGPAVLGPMGLLVGSAIGGTINAIDMFSDTETLLDIVQGLGIVDPNYRMDKTLVDNILAGIGILPAMTGATKGAKMAKFISKLEPGELNLFYKDMLAVGSYIKGYFNFANKVEKAEAKSGVSRYKVLENSRWLKEGKLGLPNEILKNLGLPELTPDQLEIVKYVHEKMSKGIYKNEYSDLRKMTEEMKKAGIDNKQIRALMENGITGEFSKFYEIVNKMEAHGVHSYLDNVKPGTNLSLEEVAGIIQSDLNRFKNKKELKSFLEDFDINISNIDEIFDGAMKLMKDNRILELISDPRSIKLGDLLMFKGHEKFNEILGKFFSAGNTQEIGKFFSHLLHSTENLVDLSKISKETLESLLKAIDFSRIPESPEIITMLGNLNLNRELAIVLKDFLINNPSKTGILESGIKNIISKLELLIKVDSNSLIEAFLKGNGNIEEIKKQLSNKTSPLRTMWNHKFRENYDERFTMIFRGKPEFFYLENLGNFFGSTFFELSVEQKGKLYDLIIEGGEYYDAIKNFRDYDNIVEEATKAKKSIK